MIVCFYLLHLYFSVCVSSLHLLPPVFSYSHSTVSTFLKCTFLNVLRYWVKSSWWLVTTDVGNVKSHNWSLQILEDFCLERIQLAWEKWLLLKLLFPLMNFTLLVLTLINAPAYFNWEKKNKSLFKCLLNGDSVACSFQEWRRAPIQSRSLI